MRKTDAHFHVNFCGFDSKKLIEYLDRNRIDKCWLLTWEQTDHPVPSLYEHISIEQEISAYNKYPDRIVPFYAPDPKSKTIVEDLEKYIKIGIKGCGELKVTYKWEDDIIEDYLKIISPYNLPLVIHMELPRSQYLPPSNSKLDLLVDQLLNGALNGVTKYYLSKLVKKTSLFSNYIKDNSIYFPGYLYDFNFLEKRIQQFPDQIFIGHGPHFWNNISNSLSSKYFHQKGRIGEFGIIDRLLEEYENLYCDISGKSGYNALTRDKNQSKRFLEKHCKKILYGTDNTNYGLEDLINSFQLSDEIQRQIFYQNSERIIPS